MSSNVVSSDLERLKDKRHALKLQSIFSSQNRSRSSHLVSKLGVVNHRNFKPLLGTQEDTAVSGVVRKRKHSQQHENVSPHKATDTSSVQTSVVFGETSLVSDEYGSNTDSDS